MDNQDMHDKNKVKEQKEKDVEIKHELNENNENIHDKRDMLKRKDENDDKKDDKKEFNHIQYQMDIDKKLQKDNQETVSRQVVDKNKNVRVK